MINKKNFYLQILAGTLSLCSVQGAVVSWTSEDVNGAGGVGDAAVINAGTLVEASNFGGAGVASPVINGVTFTGVDYSAGGSNTNFITNYTGVVNGEGIIGVGNIDTLLSSLAFTNPTSSSNFFNLSNLTSGRRYQAQFFLNHVATSGRALRIISGGGIIEIDNGSQLAMPAVQVATGTFTADAITQAVEFRALIGGANSGFQYLNGYQLRDITPVPEPSGLILTAIGSLCCIVRRKRNA